MKGKIGQFTQFIRQGNTEKASSFLQNIVRSSKGSAGLLDVISVYLDAMESFQKEQLAFLKNATALAQEIKGAERAIGDRKKLAGLKKDLTRLKGK